MKINETSHNNRKEDLLKTTKQEWNAMSKNRQTLVVLAAKDHRLV